MLSLNIPGNGTHWLLMSFAVLGLAVIVTILMTHLRYRSPETVPRLSKLMSEMADRVAALHSERPMQHRNAISKRAIEFLVQPQASPHAVIHMRSTKRKLTHYMWTHTREIPMAT